MDNNEQICAEVKKALRDANGNPDAAASIALLMPTMLALVLRISCTLDRMETQLHHIETALARR